jgi:hypothetical protein
LRRRSSSWNFFKRMRLLRDFIDPELPVCATPARTPLVAAMRRNTV